MASDVDTVPPPHGGGDLNLAIARPLFAYLEQNFGRESLAQLARKTGIDEETLLHPRRWVSLDDFESVLAAVREMVGNDARFADACRFEMVKSYGPLALVFRAGTVLMSYRVLAATVQFASRISTYELAQSTRNSVVLRYRSTKTESRLMCLSRQAQLPTVPLMFWNLPPARLTESKCVAQGDDCCEYVIRWSEPLAWRWPLAGMVAGASLAFAAKLAHLAAQAPGFYVVCGGLLGATFAFRRMTQHANDFHTETTLKVGNLVKENEEAVEQILSLHQRQEAFNALLAERIEARTSTLEAMLNELKSKGERNEVALRGLTHDIRNPLQVALLNAFTLTKDPNPEIAEMGTLIGDSVKRIEAQMKRLLEIASESEKAFALNNERMDVAQFVDRVRKNLQALVIARDIRVSVFRTREAPDAIETDTMLFDRIIDNLVSNAVKYTERGSIVVEIGGVPDHLTFKISDTGRGISAERLEKVFIGGQRDARPLLGESHGIGLSSAIRLLDEVGGKLEVMSKPGVGTTIWAHVPVKPPVREAGIIRTHDASDVLKRVVTIRTAANQ